MNYPIKRKHYQKVNNYANLGMHLESDIESSNAYYLNQGKAVIHKKPTPIQVVDVSYPMRNKAKIVEAYYKTPSTTDFNGVYNGYYIDFDAKETNSKTSIPLSNIHPHQVKHLEDVVKQKGIAFLIVHFKHHGTYFLLPFDVFMRFWEDKEKGRKSIPYSVFLDEAISIMPSFQPRLKYLDAVDTLILRNASLAVKDAYEKTT